MENKITFILGAGASQPYGLPSGLILRQNIIDELTNQNSQLFQNLTQLGFDEADLSAFKNDLMMSVTYSIDEFLKHSEKKYQQIGKICIAQNLLESENENLLYGNVDSNIDWYRYILNFLAADFNNLDKHDLSFLTFNYDRSFEHFVFNSLKSKFHTKQPQEILKKINNIPIIHLHGQLGVLPWQEEQKEYQITYGGKNKSNQIDVKNLKIASKNIKILSDNLDQHTEFVKAKKILQSTNTIVFLGFGYHDKNIERLEIDQLIGRKIFGTAINKMDIEIEEIIKKFPNTPQKNLFIKRMDSLELIKAFAILS